jgi:hypothetical protein
VSSCHHKFEVLHFLTRTYSLLLFSPSLCFPPGIRVFLVVATAAVRSHRHSGRCHSIRGTIRPCPRHNCKGLSSAGSSVPGRRPKSGSCRGGRWSLHRRRAMLCHLLFSTSGDSGCSSLIHVWAPPLLYGLELHHLNLNGIQHIAGFITLCKGFLGMESHYELWMYFFSLSPFKRTNNMLLPPMGCGSIHLTGKHVGEYMKLVLSGSNKGWQGHWFYFKNDTAASFPPYNRRTLDCHSAP